MIGTSITVKNSAGTTLLSNVTGSEVGSVPSGLTIYPGIPELAIMASALETQISSNDTDIASNLSDIADLSTLIGSITDEDGGTSTVATELNAIQANLVDMSSTVAAKIDADVAALETSLKGSSWDSNTDYASLEAVTNAFNILNSLVGSITDEDGGTSTVATELNAIQANLVDMSSTVAAKIDADVAALETSLKGSSWDSNTDYASLEAVTNAFNILNSLVGSITDEDGGTSTVATELNAIQANLVDMSSTVAAKIDADVAALETSLKGSSWDSNTDYASLEAVTNAFNILNSLVGSITDEDGGTSTVATELNAIQANLVDMSSTVAAKIDADVAALETSLKGSSWDSNTDYASLEAVTNAFNILNSLVGSITDEDGGTSTVATELNAIQANLVDMSSTVAAKIDADVAALETSLKGSSWDSNTDYASLEAVTNAFNILNSLVGSITDEDGGTSTVATELNAIQANLVDMSSTVAAKIDADVAALETSLKGSSWDSNTDYASLEAVTNAFNILNSLVGSITDEDGGTSTVATELNAIQANLVDMSSTVAAKIDADVAALETSLKGSSWDSNTDYASLEAVTNAFNILNSLVGSITDEDDASSTVATEIDALQVKLADISVVADSIKQVALIPSISPIGTDLSDGVLDNGEGSIDFRIALPSVAAADTDSVELLLAGSTFSGGAKTTTLTSTHITNGYVDFTGVTQSELGSAGVKAISAKITSGSLVGNESPALTFSLTSTYTRSDASKPNAPVLNDIASNDKINKIEHDGITWLTGSAEANSKITIAFNDGSSDVTTDYVRADEFGNWKLPYSSSDLPADDTYTVKVTATDAAGNVSDTTSQAGVIIDAAVPNAPVINLISGDDVVDGTENGAGFTITGTGEPGATITATFSSGRTLQTSGGNSATVQNDNSWTLTVAANEAGLYFREGEEVITVTQTDSAGNASVSTSRIFEVGTSFTTGGSLGSTDLSGYTKIELNAATVLPTDQSKLPSRIDAKGYKITIDGDISIASITVTNYGDLTVNENKTLTAAASQVSQFNAAGTVTATGTLAVTAGGDLSSLDLSNATVTLSSAATNLNASGLPKAIVQGSYGITLGSDTNIASTSITSANALTLGDDVTVTMKQAQHEAFTAINASGSGEQITLTTAGTVTASAAIETYVLASAGGSTITLGAPAQNVTTGADSADTIDVQALAASGVFNTNDGDIIKMSNGANISLVDGEGSGAGAALDASGLTLASGASVTMTAAQHNSFDGTISATGTGVGGEQITLITEGTVTGLSVVEKYVLADGNQTFTLGGLGQNVTTGTGDVTIKAAGTLTGTLDGSGAGENDTITLNLTGASNLVSGTPTLTDIDAITLESGVNVTMNTTQNALLTTAGGSNAVTLSNAADTTGKSSVDTYNLADGNQAFTLGGLGQNVTTGTGDVTIKAAGTLTGTLDGSGAGENDTITLNLTGASNLVTGTPTLTDIDAITLESGVNVTMNTTQHALLTTAGGSNAVTLSNAADTTGKSSVDTYNLADGNQAFTLGGLGQNVTTGTGDVTIKAAGTLTGALDGSGAGENDTITLNITADSDIRSLNLTDIDAITLESGKDLTATIAQANLITAATDTNIVTLTDNGTLTGKSVVEKYVLADGNQTFTLGGLGQNVTTGTGDVTIKAAGTLTGTLDGSGAGENDTITLNLTGASNLVSGTPTLTDIDAITLESGVNVTMNTTQNALLTTAGGSNAVTLSNAADTTGKSSVDTYNLADGNQAFTLGGLGQNVTTGTGDVTIKAAGTLTGTLDGSGAGENDTITLNLTGASNLVTGTPTLTDIDAITLESGVNVTMNTTQHALLTTAGGSNAVTLSNAADTTGKSSVDTYNLADGNQAFTLGGLGQNVTTGTGDVTIKAAGTLTGALDGSGAGENDTITLNITADSDIRSLNLTDIDAITLESGKDLTATIAQANLITAATDTNIVTLTDNGTLTGKSVVEKYVLADGNQTFTLGGLGQNVTTGTGDVTIKAAGTLTGTLDGSGAGENDTITLNLTGASNLVSGTPTLTDIDAITLESGVNVTMNTTQNALLTTAGGSNAVTLSNAADTTGKSSVDTYNLADGNQAFTLGGLGQNVTTGTGDVTIKAAGTLTGTLDGSGAGENDTITLNLTGASNLVSGTPTLTDIDAITLESGVNVTMNTTQHALLTTAGGSNAVTLSNAADTTGKSSVDTYNLADGNQTFTLGGLGQNVTTGTGDVTIKAAGTLTGALDGSGAGENDTITLNITADSDIRSLNLTDIDAITLESGKDLTATIAQANLITAATDTNIVTLTDNGTLTGKSVVEKYVLADGNQTFTLGGLGQNVTTGTGDVTIKAAGTLTGTLDGSGAGENDTITLNLTGASNLVSGTPTLTDIDAITLESGVNVTMNTTQNALLTTAGGSNAVTLSNAADTTGKSSVDTYNLADGNQAFTLGGLGQNVTTGTGDVTIKAAGTLTGTLDGSGSGENDTITLNITADSDIRSLNLTDIDAITLESGKDLTATIAQANLITAATDTNIVTLTDNGTLTGKSVVEAYNLADGGNTFNLNGNQSVTGGSGDDIISTSSQATISGTISGGSGGNDTLRINGADVVFTGATFTNIDAIDFNTGTIAATFDQADISGMTVTETGNEGTVKISSTSGSTTKFDVAGTTTLDLSNIASGVNIVFLDEDGPASTTDVNLLTGSTLTINAADLTGLTVTEGGSATVNVKDLASSTSLAGVTATNVTGHVAVSGSTSLSGDLNGATIVVDSAASTPILDLTGASNASGTLNLNDLSLQVNVTSTQHDALTFANVAGTVTARVSNSTGSTDTIDQETGIESYSLVSSSADDTITMNLLGSDAGAAVNIAGNTTAVLTLAAGNSNTFTGTWSGFAAGDTLAVSGSTLSVDVTGASSGTSLGGIGTITVANGDTLTANAAQLNAAAATGAGAITIKSLNSSTADLANVDTDTVTLDVTSGAATVGSGFALKAAKAYAVAGGSNKDLDVSTASSLGLDGGSSFAIAASTSLTAAAAQMDAVATSGEGTTTIDTLNNSTADLSEINSTTVILNVTGTEVVSSGFDLAGRAYTIGGSSATLDLSSATTLSASANYTINDGNTVKFSAAGLNGATAGGAGSVYISELDATTGVDLDAVTSSGGIEIALDADATLTSSAKIGATNLTISADSSARILDLSSVTTSNFNLSSKTLTVGENVTLKMTADQAAVPSSFTGAGNVTITSGTIDASLANSIADGISGTLVISDLSQVNGQASDLVTMLDDGSITKPSEFSSVISAEDGSAVTTAANINTINLSNSNGSISFGNGITVQDTAANLGKIVGDVTISFANNVSIKATNDVGPVLADAIYNTINGSGSKVYDVAMGVSDINNAVQASLAAATTVTVSGSSGLDSINMSTFTLSNLTIDSGAFGDVIYASLGADTIDSGTGSDNIYSFGANNITTGSGNDSINYMSSSDFGDTVTDFSATDKIDYDNSEGALSYLAINGATGVAFESVSANSTIADGTTVVELTGATNSAGDAAGLVTALGSSATNSSLATGDTLVIVSYGSSKAHVFEFIDSNNGNIEAGELSLIATLNNVDADVLTADNFI
jgi:hypothetical protein